MRRDVDPIEVRRRIGMVFPAPETPFPEVDLRQTSRTACGSSGRRTNLDDRVEQALKRARVVGRGEETG